METPVKSPNDPPIAESLASKLFLSSFVTRLKVGVAKYILTQWSLVCFLNPEIKKIIPTKYDYS